MKLDYIFHPAHKLAYKKKVNRVDKGLLVCLACLHEISGAYSEHYSCRECNFFLHKLCAELPLEYVHSLHPDHPLRLFPKCPHDNGDVINCDSCWNKVEGFVYHCSICIFSTDVICAIPDDSKLSHDCHRGHLLTCENIVKRADKGVICAACLGEISGPLENYYRCLKCNFFLHEICFKRPPLLTSPLHPHHQLRLRPDDKHIVRKGYCNGCQKKMKGFVYNCHPCEFNLDFACAFPGSEMSVQSFDDIHCHPLMLISRPAKFNCDLCPSSLSSGGGGAGVDEEDHSYLCSIPACNFWIHKKCAFKTATQRYKKHPHPLSLLQGLPKDIQIYSSLYCDVCRMTIYPTDWISYCTRCRYFVHIRCVMTPDIGLITSIKDGVDYLNDSFIKLLLNGDEFVDWPPRDVSLELIQPFLLGKRGIMMNVDEQKIRHFSHEQHEMILFQELCVNNNDSFFEEEDEEIVCDGCIHPITAPYYCCQECKYYLHLACANLPSQIIHFSHPHHELILSFQQRFYNTFRCGRCDSFSNGFKYECKECSFEIDLTCAALPAFIMHETHEHPLCQMNADDDDGPCYACDQTVSYGSLIFKCIYCNVYIHYSCAMFSRSIRHRWDRDHPIDLKFPPHDHPEDFMCDMCEELIHPKFWLYSCFRCEVSFHTKCVPRYKHHILSNVKYGGELCKSSYPHHVFKFLRKPTLKNTCDICNLMIPSDGAFECETCYHCLCFSCAVHHMAFPS